MTHLSHSFVGILPTLPNLAHLSVTTLLIIVGTIPALLEDLVKIVLHMATKHGFLFNSENVESKEQQTSI